MLFWWCTVDRNDAWLYRGGFAAHAVLTAVVIAAVCAPTLNARLLAFAPLVALGRISYGVYLFHWPIFLWLSPARTGLSFAPLLALRLATTLAIALASFHFVEEPIRRGASFRNVWPRVLTPAVACVLVVGVFAVTASPPPRAFVLAPLASQPSSARRAARTAATFPAVATRALPTPLAETFHRPLETDRPLRVLVVGDSVGITLGRGLELWSRETGRTVVRNEARKYCSLGRYLPRIAGYGPDEQGAGCDDWQTRWARRCRRLRSRCRRGPVHDLGARVAGASGRDRFRRTRHAGASTTGSGPNTTPPRMCSAQRGANVVWLTIPCTPNYPSTPGSPTWYVNERTIAGAARDRGFVRVLDLDAQVCPNHQFRSAYGGVDPARPDGNHFSDDGALAAGALDVADPARRCRAADAVQRLDPPR